MSDHLDTATHGGVPPPPKPKDGYLRAAVVQLDFLPAATIKNVNLLEQPMIRPTEPNWFQTSFESQYRRVREWESNIGKRIRNVYVEHEVARISQLLTTLASWHVKVVVFPEYSVAPECIERLLSFTKDMVVVFGTHSVETPDIDSGLYKRLGVEDPECGTAVAPIAVDGALLHLQPKLNKNHLENGLIVGSHWHPIELPGEKELKMGVLICLDFLSREAQSYQAYVAGKIDQCKLVAVPSLTPDYTVDGFRNHSIEDAQRYGRTVLYADVASGGGSSIFVDSASAPAGSFPFAIPTISKNEEGVVVVDLDVEYTATSENVHRKYVDRPAAIPVALSTLRYPILEDDSKYLAAIRSTLANCEMSSRQELTRCLKDKISDFKNLADGSAPTMQQRLNVLIETFERARSSEDILSQLRDVIFSKTTLPMSALNKIRLQVALDDANALRGNVVEMVRISDLVQRLTALCEDVT